MRLLYFVSICLLLCACAHDVNAEPQFKTPLASDDNLAAGDFSFSLNHDGVQRNYKVHVPSSYKRGTPTPMIIYVHGGAGNTRSAYLDNMDKTSDINGFILAVPEGTGEKKLGQLRASWNGGTWKGGTCCTKADDVGFIDKMIAEISTKFTIDLTRVYATGISNGGLMTNRLACELPSKIAAIATVAPAGIINGCAPGRPIPVMDIHGKQDTCNPFDGGEPSNIFCKRVDYKRLSHKEVIDFWTKYNGCSNQTEVYYENGGAHCSRYLGCKQQAEVVSCDVDGMGHTWPAGFESKLLGLTPVTEDITGNQMWEFLREHSLKP
jgi:polyhydroxybutyrate depolymerase